MSGSITLATLSASWPLPQAADLSGQYAQSYRQAFPGCDPDQPNSFMAVQGRTHGIVGFGLYLYQRALADELMLDTARTWLSRHADQWGVPRIAAAAAIGPVIFSGPTNLPLPSGIELVSQDGSGVQWITTAAAVIGGDSTATVGVQCETAGAAGNVLQGSVLTVISPIVGLQNENVVVGTGGLAGGNDIEPVDAWRARILLRVRRRGRAGNGPDYIDWAETAGAAPTPNVIARWAGPATIGVVIAMPNPAGVDRLVPTPAQVAAIVASINAVRPLSDEVVGIAAAPLVQPLTVALSPDTVVGRARAQSAAQVFLAALPIGGLLEHSELEDAILQASGSAVEMTTPPADVQAGPTQMFSAAPIVFAAYTGNAA